MITGISPSEGTALSQRIRQWSAAWETPELPDLIRVAFSSRLRSSLGRCEPVHGLVRLNARLLGHSRGLLEEVLCHEAAHIAVHILYRDRRHPHGREWRDLMAAAGFEPRVRVKVEWGDRNRQPEFVYLHCCPVCQASRAARRPVRQWHCAACSAAGLDGHLVITKQPVSRR